MVPWVTGCWECQHREWRADLDEEMSLVIIFCVVDISGGCSPITFLSDGDVPRLE